MASVVEPSWDLPPLGLGQGQDKPHKPDPCAYSYVEQARPKEQQISMDVVDAVLCDVAHRAFHGLEKHGTLLKTHNGRDALVDAYQEALDLVFYLRQALMEREVQNLK